MDDAFSYRSTLPLGPRIDRRLVKAAAALTIVATGIGFFATWVVASERESFSRAHRSTPIDLNVGQIPGAFLPAGTDADAREALRVAVAAARAAIADGGGFLAAGPSELTALQPGYTFVDGPSTIPRVVSVASEAGGWAAAARSPTGTCFWVRLGPGGRAATGTSASCTGADALEPTAPSRS